MSRFNAIIPVDAASVPKEQRPCPICRNEEVEYNQNVVPMAMLNCNPVPHYFCRACINTWFNTSNSCPSCRKAHGEVPPVPDHTAVGEDDEDDDMPELIPEFVDGDTGLRVNFSAPDGEVPPPPQRHRRPAVTGQMPRPVFRPDRVVSQPPPPPPPPPPSPHDWNIITTEEHGGNDDIPRMIPNIADIDIDLRASFRDPMDGGILEDIHEHGYVNAPATGQELALQNELAHRQRNRARQMRRVFAYMAANEAAQRTGAANGLPHRGRSAQPHRHDNPVGSNVNNSSDPNQVQNVESNMEDFAGLFYD